MDMQTLHESALSYAERGFPVFPIKPLQKRPATRNGFKDASTEVPRVNEWWERNAGFNIGLSCEPMLILDVDRKNGGDETFARMCSEIGANVFDGVPLVATPGGRHFWFRRPEPPITRHNGILPGIDLLGLNGYAIAPPSVRNDGAYRWAPEFEDDAEELLPGDLPEFPRIVHDYLLAASAKTELVTPSKLVAVRSMTPVVKIGEGARNSWLTSVAGALVAKHIPAAALGPTLYKLNETACEPPLPLYEVDAILNSAKGFHPRFPFGQFILPYLRAECDFRTADGTKRSRAVRLLMLYALWADQDGVCTARLEQLTEALGMSENMFYDTRKLLVNVGAISVRKRGLCMTSLVTLQWREPVLRSVSSAA
jgi:hypothetical protein